MKLRGKLVRLYFFRVTPGTEATVVKELRRRLREQSPDEWSFFSWFGRFDLLIASESDRLFAQDTFLFTPHAPESVLDVAEMILLQGDLSGFPGAPGIGQVLLGDGLEPPPAKAPWVSLTYLKLDHERLLDPATLKACDQFLLARGSDAPSVLPYCWATQEAAMHAVRLAAAEISTRNDFGPLALAIGAGLGDSEIVLASRFRNYRHLLALLERCGALRVGDILPGCLEPKDSLAAPLFLSTFTQQGIDYHVVEPGFSRDDYDAIRFADDQVLVNAALQSSGPRSRTVPTLRNTFTEEGWGHAQVLGEIDDIFYSRQPMPVRDLMARWVQFRREIGRADRASNKDRTELVLFESYQSTPKPSETPRPSRISPLAVESDVISRFMAAFSEAPQEVRAVEHIFERCSAMSQNSGATLALVDFLPYFGAVRRKIGKAVAAAEELVGLEDKTRKALELGRKNVDEGRETLTAVQEGLQRLEWEIDAIRDDHARDLRQLTDTVRHFDAALAQRLSTEAEELLTGSFSSRATSHLGSHSRLIMAGSYLAQATYGHLQQKVAALRPELDLRYEGFIVYCRDNEAWSFSLDICQLPHSVLWRPDTAGILLHEIGHQIAAKVQLDQELERAVQATLDPAVLASDKSSADELSGYNPSLSNLWADLFWCASSYGLSEAGARRFMKERLTWLADRQSRYTTYDLRRSMGRFYAVAVCCGLLDRNRPDMSLSALQACYPQDEGLRAVKETVRLWVKEGAASGGYRPGWIVRGIDYYLGAPDPGFRCSDRYRQALIMAEAIRGAPHLLAVLTCGPRMNAEPELLTSETWRRFRAELQEGRVPGPEFSPRTLGIIPQVITSRLKDEGVTKDIRASLALCLWLYDLYCREVLALRWRDAVSSPVA